MKVLKTTERDGWSIGLESRRNHEFIPGTLYSAFGAALLFYRPERRLSISVWLPSLHGIGGWSGNLRLWGPRKLSWET